MDMLTDESVIYLHICYSPNLFHVVEPTFFSDQYIARLFNLTKAFYVRFREIPFKREAISSNQIKEIAKTNVDKLIIDKTISKEENFKNFMVNVEQILAAPYNDYNEEHLKAEITAWVEWKNFIRGLKGAIEYEKTQEKSSANIKKIINKCRSIIIEGSTVIIDEDEGTDFFDPHAHKQLEVTGLHDSGYPTLNEWLSGKKTGGFEPGTLTIFIGEPNIGKSIVLQNLALNLAMNGNNVFYISLEMGEGKIHKRMGVNALDIPIGEYPDKSNDVDYIAEKLKEYSASKSEMSIPHGVLRVKKFSKVSGVELEAFVRKYEQRHNMKFNDIILDYMTEMDNSHGTNAENMYLFHKQNANDLYVAGCDNDWAMITAHQIKGDDYGKDDLNLFSFSESRGLGHRADTVIGLIQTPEMRVDSKFYWKCIKPRDGAFKNWKMELDIAYEHMRLTETGNIYSPLEQITFKDPSR